MRSRTVPSPAGRTDLTERDADLLCDVFLQRVATRKQVQALGYFGSTTVACARLRKLFDGRYLRRSYVSAGAYAAEALYLLGPAAVDTVAARLGVERGEVARVARTGSPGALAHAKALVDVRICFGSRVPPGTGAEWLAECQVRHEYSVRDARGTSRHVLKPDGAVILSLGGAARHLYLVELDLGHVGLVPWRRSCAGYRRYLGLGLHREAYGVRSADVLCVTSGGERRIGHLSSAAQAEGAPMRFASLDAFLSEGPFARIWRRPGNPGPDTLRWEEPE